MISHYTGVNCDHISCNSNNATIILDGSNYCSEHAFYKQTGKIHHLEMMNEKRIFLRGIGKKEGVASAIGKGAK